MKIYVREMGKSEKYLIKGITLEQYETGKYDETELYSKIYEILTKYDISDAELVNSKGEPLWK